MEKYFGWQAAEKACKWCKTLFTPTHPNGVYCGAECVTEVSRKTARDYYRQYGSGGRYEKWKGSVSKRRLISEYFGRLRMRGMTKLPLSDVLEITEEITGYADLINADRREGLMMAKLQGFIDDVKANGHSEITTKQLRNGVSLYYKIMTPAIITERIKLLHQHRLIKDIGGGKWLIK